MTTLKCAGESRTPIHLHDPSLVTETNAPPAGVNALFPPDRITTIYGHDIIHTSVNLILIVTMLLSFALLVLSTFIIVKLLKTELDLKLWVNHNSKTLLSVSFKE